MSKHDGRTINVLHKLFGLLDRLRGAGVQQVEVDSVGGIQHVKWSDPELADKLEQERSVVDGNTVTGFRGSIAASERRALPRN